MSRGLGDVYKRQGRIIVPELIYTIMVTLIVYPLILWVNHKLEAEEKRSASKFV